MITESLGLDKLARQAEICAKSKADILCLSSTVTRLCHQYDHCHQNIGCALNVRPCPHNGSMPVAKPIGSEEGALDHFLWSSSVLPSFPWL